MNPLDQLGNSPTGFHAIGLTPQPGVFGPHADTAWRFALARIIRDGQVVSPRGLDCLELLHQQLVSIDMCYPVVLNSTRKLSYEFMAAEALWILHGDNRLAPLIKHAPQMARFSDNGTTLAGAYGPPVVAQLNYVVEKLLEDRDTRQAVLSIWRPNPPPSKDIPCTLSMVFSIRKNRLHAQAFMRSSDIWLGLPYDLFSFNAIALWVACQYNLHPYGPAILPGTLTVSATSAHLYLKDRVKATEVLESEHTYSKGSVPEDWVRDGNWIAFEAALVACEAGGGSNVWRIRP